MPAPLMKILVDGEKLEQRVLGLLTRLEVRESDKEASLAAMRFRLVQESGGAYTPLDDELFTAGATIGVEVAAPGGLNQRLFEGFLTHVRPHFETIESNCYLEVLAMDAAALLDAEERTASYPDSTDRDAAEEVLDRYGITLVSDDTPARHQTDHQMLIQRGTDWQFLRMLAARNGYCCYFEYDPEQSAAVGYFRKRDLAATPQADLTILRENSNLRWLDIQLLTRGPVRHTGAAIDPIRKRILRGEGEAELAPLGEDGLDGSIEQGWQRHGAGSAQAFLRDPFPLDAAVSALSTALTDDARFTIEARGELDCALYRGILRARRPVLIKGSGRLLSGTYYVSVVRTVIDQGTLTQSFVAERNALAQSGRESFGQQAEEVPPA